MIKLYICCLVLIIGSVEVGLDIDMKCHQEVMEIVSYDTTKVVQIDSEWPILAVLQLFQYFPTKVVQIDSEWPILAVLQLFQIFSYQSGPN